MASWFGPAAPCSSTNTASHNTALVTPLGSTQSRETPLSHTQTHTAANPEQTNTNAVPAPTGKNASDKLAPLCARNHT